jgi:signal transduction histidine kinase
VVAHGHSGRTALVVSLVVLAVLILNLALWWSYRDMRRDLEAGLGRTLENMAVLVANSLAADRVQRAALVLDVAAEAGDSLAVLEDPDVQGVFLDLAQIRDQTQVANLTLYDASATAILDVAQFRGATPTRSPLVSSALRLALITRIPAHSALIQNQWMTGYAPLDVFGDAYAIGVEADAPFFVVLERLQRSLLWVGVLSVVLLVALGGFFVSFQNRVARAETAARRADTLAAVGRMSAGIAHDIRNPLNIIRATATRLQKRYDDPEHPDEKFRFIPEEVDRLNTTLTSYLHFARDEAPRLQEQDVTTVVDKTLRMMHHELDDASIRLEWNAGRPVSARIDEHYLRQAILNVVLNAQEAMPRGGTLHVAIVRDGSELHLRFADTGPGIAPDQRSRMLEPFVTTKEQGSGLGLTMVQRIATQHGGRVVLDEAPGGGALVDIVLPAP